MVKKAEKNDSELKAFNVHFTLSEHTQLKIQSALQDRSIKSIVEDLTRDYLKKLKKRR